MSKNFFKNNFIYFLTRSRGQKTHKVFFSEISTIIQQVVGRWRLRPPPTCIYIFYFHILMVKTGPLKKIQVAWYNKGSFLYGIRFRGDAHT